jgi:hypothetical protein
MRSKRKSISLAPRVADHDRERKELERLGASKPFEQPSATISRLETEHANLEDQAAGLTPEDDQLEPETHTLEGKRTAALGRSQSSAAEAQRLRRSAETGHGLERAILESQRLRCSLPAKQPIPTGRICWIAAHRTCPVRRAPPHPDERTRDDCGRLAFLDAEGVSSVPGDVNLVVQALRDAGIAHAVPAEHYLAQYRPDADKALALLRSDPARFSGVFVSHLDRPS